MLLPDDVTGSGTEAQPRVVYDAKRQRWLSPHWVRDLTWFSSAECTSETIASALAACMTSACEACDDLVAGAGAA
jgi:hypothetical protein